MSPPIFSNPEKTFTIDDQDHEDWPVFNLLARIDRHGREITVSPCYDWSGDFDHTETWITVPAGQALELEECR